MLSEAQNTLGEGPHPTVGPGGKKQKKKSSREKLSGKQAPQPADFTKRLEWDFSWNCSVIQGHLDTLGSIEKEARAVLAHLKEAGCATGLVRERGGSLKKSNSKLSTSSDGSRDWSRAEKNEDDSDSSSRHSKSPDKNLNSNNNENGGDCQPRRDADSNGPGTLRCGTAPPERQNSSGDKRADRDSGGEAALVSGLKIV